MPFPGDESQNSEEVKKAEQQKKQIELDQFNLFLKLISENLSIQYQLMQRDRNAQHEEVSSRDFEKNVNQALTVLKAAQLRISNEGVTPFSDYLTVTAIRLVADYLPEDKIKMIIQALDEQSKPMNESDIRNDRKSPTPAASTALELSKNKFDTAKKIIPPDVSKKTELEEETKQAKGSESSELEDKKPTQSESSTHGETKQAKGSESSKLEEKKPTQSESSTHDETKQAKDSEPSEREQHKEDDKTVTPAEKIEEEAKQSDLSQPSHSIDKTVNSRKDELVGELITRVTSPDSSKTKIATVIDPKQVIIDIASDKLPYKIYADKVAQRLKGSLISVSPLDFQNIDFAISEGMTLTLFGHCSKGSPCLVDNSRNPLFVHDIAQKIFSILSPDKLDTDFKIDLIACQAAASNGNKPAFAQRLIDELSKRGINNVSVIASPTIMMTTSTGVQSNLSFKEDKRMDEEIKTGKKQATSKFSYFSNLFSAITGSDEKIHVEKVTFRSNKRS